MRFITEERFMGAYNYCMVNALMDEDENDNKMECWNRVNSRCLMNKIKRNGNIVKITIKERGYKDHYELIDIDIIEGEKLGVIDTMRFSFAELLGENRKYMYRNGVNMWWTGSGVGSSGNYLGEEEYEVIARSIMNYIYMYA